MPRDERFTTRARQHMQSGVTQQWQSAAELSTPPHEAAIQQSDTPASWHWSRGSGEWSASPRAATRSVQAPQRKQAAVAGRIRALSPRGQLAQLNNLLLSLDSCAEGTEQMPITTPQTGRVSEQTLRRRCSETQRPAPVACQPLRRHRSQPADDLAGNPARPIRSISPAPQKPVRRRHSASLHPHDVQPPLPFAAKLPRTAVHSLFIDSTGLERNEAPLRERAAPAERTRALSPRSQFAQLHTLFASHVSDAEGTDCTLTTKRPQPGRLVPKQPLRRHHSQTQRAVADDYQSHSLRRDRSQLADDLPEEAARPMRSSTSLVPEQPMRLRSSASPRRHGVHSIVADDISLDRRDTASVQLARVRPRKTTLDNPTAAHRHARQRLPVTSDSNSNARLAEWCHGERNRSHSLGMLTPGAGSKESTSSTAVVLECPPGRSTKSWWHACRQVLVAFFNSLWAALALATALLPGRTCRYASAKQAKVDTAEVACEFTAAQTDLHACKEEYLRCKTALVLAEKRFARAATPLLSFSPPPSPPPSSPLSVSTASEELT